MPDQAETGMTREELEKCCAQRGARMQMLYRVLLKVMRLQVISFDEWEEITSMFDEHGVPK